ncbi:MAG: long-chain fatty acid--CoA ligase, partial [Alphaproteobacteria bacterium HGW-Alphaproteobacteria-12]
MQGLMQNWPLRVTSIIDHAARFHGDREIVTRTVEGPIARTTYRQVHLRARKVAQALTRLGIKEGDIVATMAWNTARHLEAWYGIMGMGAVCHTLNPRLFAEQLVYIVNHAEDKVIFLDLTFVPILEGIADKLPNVKAYVVMTDRAHMPETSLPNALCFEEIVEAENGEFK